MCGGGGGPSAPKIAPPPADPPAEISLDDEAKEKRRAGKLRAGRSSLRIDLSTGSAGGTGSGVAGGGGLSIGLT